MSKAYLADISDLQLERWLRRRNAGQIVWRTKDGKVIPIKDMTDEHLANTIAMISETSVRIGSIMRLAVLAPKKTYGYDKATLHRPLFAAPAAHPPALILPVREVSSVRK